MLNLFIYGKLKFSSNYVIIIEINLKPILVHLRSGLTRGVVAL
jgi:hypothetical protein